MSTTRVILLDDDEDLRDAFAELGTHLGVDVTVVSTVTEMETAVNREHTAFDLAILDINLGPEMESGVDAYRWLRDQHFGGRIVFLTGHARSHPLVTEARRLGDASVHNKPLRIDQLRELLAPIRSA